MPSTLACPVRSRSATVTSTAPGAAGTATAVVGVPVAGAAEEVPALPLPSADVLAPDLASPLSVLGAPSRTGVSPARTVGAFPLLSTRSGRFFRSTVAVAAPGHRTASGLWARSSWAPAGYWTFAGSRLPSAFRPPTTGSFGSGFSFFSAAWAVNATPSPTRGTISESTAATAETVRVVRHRPPPLRGKRSTRPETGCIRLPSKGVELKYVCDLRQYVDGAAPV